MQSASPPPGDAGWQVICLCAAWCGACREWAPVFDELAGSHPGVRFAWVDIEDDADAMGDVDVETFPTLLVARDGQARFFGPVQPSVTQVSRLLDSLRSSASGGARVVPEATSLLVRLRTRVLPKS
jgi:thioredoxin 1